MLELNTPLNQVPGLGYRFLKKFNKLNLITVKDLLWHFPSRYEDFSRVKKIADVRIGEQLTIQGQVKTISAFRTPKKRMKIVQALISDGSGTIQAIWFNQFYIRTRLKKGTLVNLAGKVSVYKNKLCLNNPTYEILKNKVPIHTARIVPIYPETKGLTSKGIRHFIRKILMNLKPIPEFLPKLALVELNFPEINKALWQIHFPENLSEINPAKKRFAFQDLFLLQLNNLIERWNIRKHKAYPFKIDYKRIKQLLAKLPFQLTISQKKCLFQILKDLQNEYPMNRLLQGEVGSGKTILSFLAANVVAEQNQQVALLAPTEILAFQHYQAFKKFFPKFEKGVCILTSKQKRIFYSEKLECKTTKKELLPLIESGKIKIVIGTQTLIQKEVKFSNLALVVIDEQHRFGVKQRAKLLKEGTTNIPHFLSMTATPIPRTLGLAIFGDLDMSRIEELPKNRKPVITKIIPPKKRKQAYSFIRAEIKKGNQAFVVCPRIEPTNKEANNLNRKKLIWAEVKAVKEEYQKLSKKIFPDLKVEMLHGKMDSEKKEKIINRFKDGKIDILVSTSVIEVGIDIPNATIMVIEGAERFGLAQLYQLRGRVGRREKQSYCFLFSDLESKTSRQRLESIIKAKNAFELAEQDLKLRGPGEFLGESQTGLPDLAMQALNNPELVKVSREIAIKTLKIDPSLKAFPELRKKVIEFYKEVHLE